MSFRFWCWFLPFVELVVVVVALTDNEAGVKVPWFWILLLLFASIGLLGAGTSLVRLDRPEGDDLPRSGCLPLVVWSVFAFLSLAFVVASIVWLAGDADSAGSRWTLLPIVAVMLLGGLGAWMVRASRGSVGPVDARGIAAATTVFLSLLGIVALLWWFVGGSRSIETLGDAGAETVIQPAPEEPEVADEVPDTAATTETESPVITDTPPVEVEDAIVVPETPVGTPLHPDVATLISRWCVTNMSDANADLTMEALFSEPTRATGPVEGDMYPRAENPPAAVDIEYVGVASGGCDGQPKMVVIASLGGPPSDVQLSLAIDLPDTAGHTAEPTSSGGIALISGWDEFIAYEAGAGADGIFQSDGNFFPIPTTAMVDMEGNNFAFIVDRPSDATSIDFILQTFYRMGVTESDPILWNTVTITYSR